MYLKNLRLRSFRNYLDQKVTFESQKTIVLGNNAQGKSNLLEAIELLSTLKTHRSNRDCDLVREGDTIARIEATLERAYGQADLAIILHQQGRRNVFLNQESLRRQLDFLGVLNTVRFSSLDLDLVRGSPESRRDWVDSLLVQLEPIYAHILHQYQKILRQRNAYLKKDRKQFQLGLESQVNQIDHTQLELWDQQLAQMGSRVTRRRARVLKRLTPIAREWHNTLSGKTEQLDIEYLPNVNWSEDNPENVQQAFLAQIKERRLVEQSQGLSLVGPHRDEVNLIINQTPVRSYGSQGQQRTLVLALKLAELQLVEDVIGEPPVLLLDDVLAELDPHRQNLLLETIQDRFQTIITTTHLNSFDAQWLRESQILSVEAGNVKGI
jgi:DNA replication and repair protein RecF